MNRITDYGKLATDITNWIKDYAQSNGIKSLVVGVSGGIDSAVVSTLCARTGLRFYPCRIGINSSRTSRQLAEEHIKWLYDNYGNSNGWHFEMGGVYDSFVKNMGSLSQSDHGLANSKSRLRMMVLYQVATVYNGIVVGTGNKVEDFGVGFYTKYGDGGVDISPIADLYKSEVRELGRYLGISQDIIDAVPTDGLWEDGRCDEDQIGATYEELEWVMSTDTPTSQFTDRQSKVAEIYMNLHQKNLHKMLPIPIYKLTV